MIDQEKLFTELQALTEAVTGISKVLGEIVQAVAMECDMKEGAPRIQPLEIMSVVANYYRMDRADLYRKGKNKTQVRKKQMVMVLCRRLTDLSLSEIGNIFELDHTTVVHAVNNWGDHLSNEPELNADFQKISNYLAAQAEKRAGASRYG